MNGVVMWREMSQLFRMRFRGAWSTIIFVSWTLCWIAFSFRQVWLGYVQTGSRRASREIYTAEEHPVAFYTLLAIHGACALLGVYLTYSHIRSCLIDARVREEEQRAAAERKAKRQTKHRVLQPMTDEQKTSLVRRARKRVRGASLAQKDPRKNG